MMNSNWFLLALLVAITLTLVLLLYVIPTLRQGSAPTVEQRRRAMVEETRSALLDAHSKREDWSAEVDKLSARLVRLEGEARPLAIEDFRLEATTLGKEAHA